MDRCFSVLKNIYADLKRRGAPGAFLYFILVADFFVMALLLLVLVLPDAAFNDAAAGAAGDTSPS
jgi:hypothetical protein